MFDDPTKADFEEMLQQMRHLANRWTLLARDYNRDSKTNLKSKELPERSKGIYQRGISETYRKLALEIADVVKRYDSSPVITESFDDEEEVTTYAAVALNEVLSLMDYAGVSARDVRPHRDNSFTAYFSKLQGGDNQTRINLLISVDSRVVLLGQGRTQETNEPYISFAFQEAKPKPAADTPAE